MSFKNVRNIHVAWQTKNFHHKDLIPMAFQNLISPSSPPICSWSFGKSDPPTKPTATFLRSSFMNSFISGVISYNIYAIELFTEAFLQITSQTAFPWTAFPWTPSPLENNPQNIAYQSSWSHRSIDIKQAQSIFTILDCRHVSFRPAGKRFDRERLWHVNTPPILNQSTCSILRTKATVAKEFLLRKKKR